MNLNKIEESIVEAKRFLKACDELLKNKNFLVDVKNHPYIRTSSISSFPKLTGAIRRSSLDLTRSLAKMRKYNDN